MLNIRQLALLEMVVETGSITGCAAALNYTPSAVSQQLRKLETEVGQPLLIRLPRGVALTEAGAVLAGHARLVQQQLAAAEADLAEVAGLRRGKLSIASFATVGSSFLPFAVRRFKRSYPQIELTVHSARLVQLQDWLRSGAVDVALMWDYEWSRIPSSEFALIKLLDDPTMLVVSTEHRLARRRLIRLAELSREDWVGREKEHPVLEVLERSARAAGFQPRIALNVSDYQEVQAMVSVGLGVALAPLTAVTTKRPDIRVISLGSTAPSRRVVLALRHGRVRAPTETAIIQVMKEAAEEYRRTVHQGGPPA